MIPIPEYIREVDRSFPAFREDYEKLLNLTASLLTHETNNPHLNGVLALVEMAVETYDGMLALVANNLGLPSASLSRNLFEIVLSAVHLTRHPECLNDFVDYGKLIALDLIRKLDSSNDEIQRTAQERIKQTEREYQRLAVRFKMKNGSPKRDWKDANLYEIAEENDLEGAFVLLYPIASSIAHGDSYPVLRRISNSRWRIDVNRTVWDGFKESSLSGGLLMLAFMFERVNGMFGLGYDEAVSQFTTSAREVFAKWSNAHGRGA